MEVHELHESIRGALTQAVQDSRVSHRDALGIEGDPEERGITIEPEDVTTMFLRILQHRGFDAKDDNLADQLAAISDEEYRVLLEALATSAGPRGAALGIFIDGWFAAMSFVQNYNKE